MKGDKIQYTKSGKLKITDSSGDIHSLKNVDVTINTGSVGSVAGPGNIVPPTTFEYGGHTITLTDDSGYKCNECNESFELPALLEDSGTPFVQVVWKLYLIGKFEDETCDASEQPGSPDLLDNSLTSTNDITDSIRYHTTSNSRNR